MRSGRPCAGPNGCGGVWYSHRTFELLKEEAKSAGQGNLDAKFAPQSAFPGPSGAPKIDCPDCAAPMAQRHFRFEGRATPIVIDDCKEHGIWFDAEEFEAALQVVRAHAQAMARHRRDGVSPNVPSSSDPQRARSEDAQAFAEIRAKGEADRIRSSAAEVAETFADFALFGILASFFE